MLDVRERDEWDAGHIEAALHVPLSELTRRVGEVPASGQVVVVCRMGARSAEAVAYLNAMGLHTVNLAGGMHAWADAGRPMASAGGRSPAVL